MAINKKLIHFKNKLTFELEVANENILDTSIVFIQDSKEISTHGTIYKTVNWSVLESKPSIKNYMRFVAIEDSQINLTSVNMATGEADNSVDMKHSKDGITWTQYDFNPIPLAAGETLYLKGNNENGFIAEPRICTFGDLSFIGLPIQSIPSTGKFECHGNIMSLLYGDDFEDKTTIPSMACFCGLFAITPITTAPELPATTLAKSCYTSMFYNCTSLTAAPELPATTLAELCYSGMFGGCTNLTTAPELPATTLVDACYRDMFSGCENLTTAPELPATTMVDRCYCCMFYGCSGLTTAPELPATTLAEDCYAYMFYGCTNLTTAPELPATILVDTCYSYMFYVCTSLNHITMLATDISANDCLNEWVSDVSPTGTFVKHPDMTSLPNGTSGIPNDWVVEDAVIS